MECRHPIYHAVLETNTSKVELYKEGVLVGLLRKPTRRVGAYEDFLEAMRTRYGIMLKEHDYPCLMCRASLLYLSSCEDCNNTGRVTESAFRLAHEWLMKEDQRLYERDHARLALAQKYVELLPKEVLEVLQDMKPDNWP